MPSNRCSMSKLADADSSYGMGRPVARGPSVCQPWPEWSRHAPTGANQTTSTESRGGATCSQMTISKILSLGHCCPQLGQRSGSRGTGGSFSSLMTTGCCHHSRQVEHGNDPIAFSSFFRRCLSDIRRLRGRLKIPRQRSVSVC